MVLLKAEHITKKYSGRTIIKDINIELHKGELISLLGVSGSGKTTLFHVLSGLTTPEEGKVLLNGEDITSKPGQISYMLQKDLLFPHKKIIDNTALPLVLHGMSKKEAAEKFVKFLFEEESQRASNDEGLAVNSKVYEDMAYWKMGKSSGDTIGSIETSYDTGDGNIKQLEMDEIIPEDEAIQNIMDLGKTLTVPAKRNQIIRNAVTESGEKYLNGETRLDDAVKEIMQEVNLYLSE